MPAPLLDLSVVLGKTVRSQPIPDLTVTGITYHEPQLQQPETLMRLWKGSTYILRMATLDSTAQLNTKCSKSHACCWSMPDLTIQLSTKCSTKTMQKQYNCFDYYIQCVYLLISGQINYQAKKLLRLCALTLIHEAYCTVSNCFSS